MSLKFKLDSLDGLDDATKALYEQKGEKFVLKVDGLEEGDSVGLKNKVETLLGETAALKKRLSEKDEAEKVAQAAARKAAEDAAAKGGDIEALRKSADERVAAARAEVEGQLKPRAERAEANAKRLLIDNRAQELANKLALPGSAPVLIDHIAKRLRVDDSGDEWSTVVVDSKGQASALTIDDLAKEFVSNPAFAPVIAGSKGSGGGATGNQNKGGGAAGAKQMKRAEFDALNPVQQHAEMKAKTVLVD